MKKEEGERQGEEGRGRERKGEEGERKGEEVERKGEEGRGRERKGEEGRGRGEAVCAIRNEKFWQQQQVITEHTSTLSKDSVTAFYGPYLGLKSLFLVNRIKYFREKFCYRKDI